MKKYLLMLGLGLAGICCQAQEPKNVFSPPALSKLEQEIAKIPVYGVITDKGIAVFACYYGERARTYNVAEDGLKKGTVVYFKDRNALLDYVMQRSAGKRPHVSAEKGFIGRCCKPKDIVYYSKRWDEQDKKVEEYKKKGVWDMPFFITFEGEIKEIPKQEYD